jgi:hypothetical protein
MKNALLTEIDGVSHTIDSIHKQFAINGTTNSELPISVVDNVPEISLQMMMFDGSVVSAAAGIVHNI